MSNTPTEVEFVDGLAGYATYAEATQREVVDVIDARAEAGYASSASYDIDTIADEVLGDSSNGHVRTVDDDTFWEVVAANHKGDHDCKLRRLLDYFRPVGTPDDAVQAVLDVIAGALTWDEISTVGDFIEGGRLEAEERTIRNCKWLATNAIQTHFDSMLTV